MPFEGRRGMPATWAPLPSVSQACAALILGSARERRGGVARSTYYGKPAISIDDTALVETMAAISDSFEAYGYRRMQAAVLLHASFRPPRRPFAAIRLGRRLPLPSCRTCSAHKKNPPEAGWGFTARPAKGALEKALRGIPQNSDELRIEMITLSIDLDAGGNRIVLIRFASSFPVEKHFDEIHQIHPGHAGDTVVFGMVRIHPMMMRYGRPHGIAMRDGDAVASAEIGRFFIARRLLIRAEFALIMHLAAADQFARKGGQKFLHPADMPQRVIGRIVHRTI